MNVGSLLHYWARRTPEKLAVVCGAHRLSFREYSQRVDRVAQMLLALGLRRGDKLAIALPNCIELLELYRAAAHQGIVLVPLSTLLRGPALASLLRDADAAAVVASSALVEALDVARRELPAIPGDRYLLVDREYLPGYRSYAALVAAAPATVPEGADLGDDDLFNIIYSSGTTGDPKGIMHTHYVRAMYCTLFANAYRMTQESVVMHAGSLVFNGAFVLYMPTWLLGCTFVLQERFEPVGYLDAIAREQVTHVMTVPSQVVALLEASNFSGETLRSLEAFSTVGAPLHRQHKDRMLAVLPDAMYELYGLTEGFITILDRSDYATRIDSVGTPTLFNEMRILDDAGQEVATGVVGEIVGRAPFLMPGYYQRPDLTATAMQGGWLHTGDLGYVDEDGFLYLVDRKKDLIISGGVNVYPRDIEEVVVTHPSVREAAVFGIPDDKWGEVPMVAVVLREQHTAEPADLREWINARVQARYQRVCNVLILVDMPRSTAGKTLKRVLREQYLDQSGPLVPGH